MGIMELVENLNGDIENDEKILAQIMVAGYGIEDLRNAMIVIAKNRKKAQAEAEGPVPDIRKGPQFGTGRPAHREKLNKRGGKR